jgi:CheY-like chemotaxis protein
VDDEEPLVKLSQQMLQSLGYQVTSVQRPREALALFRQSPERYDLIITDMTMPELSGHHFATEVLKIRPDMPIVICTGHSEVINQEWVHELGIKKIVTVHSYRGQRAEASGTALLAAVRCSFTSE